MKSIENNPQPLPLHDYDVAVKSAVSWMGDRYLLAEPVSRRREARAAAPFFNEVRRWHRPSPGPR